MALGSDGKGEKDRDWSAALAEYRGVTAALDQLGTRLSHLDENVRDIQKTLARMKPPPQQSPLSEAPVATEPGRRPSQRDPGGGGAAEAAPRTHTSTPDTQDCPPTGTNTSAIPLGYYYPFDLPGAALPAERKNAESSHINAADRGKDNSLSANDKSSTVSDGEAPSGAQIRNQLRSVLSRLEVAVQTLESRTSLSAAHAQTSAESPQDKAPFLPEQRNVIQLSVPSREDPIDVAVNPNINTSTNTNEIVHYSPESNAVEKVLGKMIHHLEDLVVTHDKRLREQSAQLVDAISSSMSRTPPDSQQEEEQSAQGGVLSAPWSPSEVPQNTSEPQDMDDESCCDSPGYILRDLSLGVQDENTVWRIESRGSVGGATSAGGGLLGRAVYWGLKTLGLKPPHPSDRLPRNRRSSRLVADAVLKSDTSLHAARQKSDEQELKRIVKEM